MCSEVRKLSAPKMTMYTAKRKIHIGGGILYLVNNYIIKSMISAPRWGILSCPKETPSEALGLGPMPSSVPSIISFITPCYGIYC